MAPYDASRVETMEKKAVDLSNCTVTATVCTDVEC